MGTIYKEQVELQLPHVLCVQIHSLTALHVLAQPHALPVNLERNILIILYLKIPIWWCLYFVWRQLSDMF